MTTHTGGPDAAAPQFLADPYRAYGALREQGALVAGTFMGRVPVWYATRFAEANAVLNDSRFVNDPASVPGGDVPDLIGQLIQTYGSRCPGPVELVERFCYPLPITVICELVGIPESDRPAWRAWGRELVSMDPTRMPPAYRAMVAGIRKLIGIRRETPAEDLLSALIRAHDTEHGRLSDQELVTFVVTLVLAGHETTAHLIGNSVVALLGHPDQLALLRAQPERWPGAVHELVRTCGMA